MNLLSIIAILSGFLFTLNSFLNAELANRLGDTNGPLFSSWFAHASGSITGVILLFLFSKTRPTKKGLLIAPWWSYTPGIIGIFIVVLVNWTINSPIGLAGCLSLMLLGQTLWGRVADAWGLLGLQRRPVTKQEIAQIILTLCGSMILIFLSKQVELQTNHSLLVFLLYMSMGILSGVLIGLTQAMNARLADTTTPLFASFTNHATGLLAGLPLVCISMNPITVLEQVWHEVPLFYTLGGTGGILTVALAAFLILKIGVSKNTLFLISGMMISSTLWDAWQGILTSIPASIAGVVIIIAGTIINLKSDHKV